eukprot:CAMPEP_0198213580 /NCGR_PEP_ID=MMETSP1445-20131203/28948_1 /TAXON_ID=36898 /ORGANISM="Pyramimonas sp., Strain CCMP2087" /LENGTH=287 /DNA_ID=CAMNT_0043888245 /DNA_START=461 /DNA_END=1324 /DNA_ORIENTATION=+
MALPFNTNARQEACELLGLKEGESKQEIKHAFRRLALRYHPDVSQEHGDTTEHFVKLQRAYLLLTSTNKDADLSTLEENFDWSEHDFFWMSKFDQVDNVGRKKTREQTQAQVQFQLQGLGKPLKKNRRRVVPMHASKEQAWPPEAEEDQTEADTELQPAFRAGPVSAKSSTPESHERLKAHLTGLKRAAILRKKVKCSRPEHEDEECVPSDFESLTDGTFKVEAVTEVEKRFLRLAKLAQEWRRSSKKDFDLGHENENWEKEKRQASAREALQAAVQGVAIGAFTEI